MGPVDIELLREERETRLAHLMPAHLRTEAHPLYTRPCYPAGTFQAGGNWTYEDNARLIEEARERAGSIPPIEGSADD